MFPNLNHVWSMCTKAGHFSSIFSVKKKGEQGQGGEIETNGLAKLV